MDKYTRILEDTQKPGSTGMKSFNQENTFTSDPAKSFKKLEVSYPRNEKKRFKKSIWSRIGKAFGGQQKNRL